MSIKSQGIATKIRATATSLAIKLADCLPLSINALIDVGQFLVIKTPADTAGVSSSGRILTQDYVSDYYFADSYVGTEDLF